MNTCSTTKATDPSTAACYEVLVGQANRRGVRETLQAAGYAVLEEGYSDSSTTTWLLVVQGPAVDPERLQDVVWAGHPSIWCVARSAA